MKTDTFVAVVGHPLHRADISERRSEAILNKWARDALIRGFERVRVLRDEMDAPASGMIFTSGYWSVNFGGTIADAMNTHTEGIIKDFKKEGHVLNIARIVNRDRELFGLVREMEWAYKVAWERSSNPRIEFVGDALQNVLVPFFSWFSVMIPNCQVVPKDEFASLRLGRIQKN